MIRSIVVFLALSFAMPLPAQERPSRFELGQRLRRVERAYEAKPGRESRERVLGPMLAAVKGFFSLDLGKVARELDGAYLALLGAEPMLGWDAEDQAALEEMIRRVLRTTRFLESEGLTEISVSLGALYPGPVGREPADEGRFLCLFRNAGGADLASAECSIGQAEARLVLPDDLKPGDYTLQVEGSVGGKTMEVGRAVVSWVPNRKLRMRAIAELMEKEPLGPMLADPKATLSFGLRTLERAFEKQNLEMDFPAHRVLGQMESLAQRAHKTDWLQSDGQEQWLSLTGNPKGRAFLRIMAPKQLEPSPRPCVIAMHGAGGSENLFFDGYGDGKVADLCRERGWVLIAPRVSFAGMGIPFEKMLEDLSGPLSIDRNQVFLIGHSMGVSACSSALRQAKKGEHPPYLAVAAIAGGRRFKEAPAPKDTHFMVITASDDFARRGALGMHKSLVELGFTTQIVDMDEVEHMGVVHFTLPQVFEFFDDRLRK